jgi:acetolactate synthase-1/2/3 large subunit
VATLNGSQSTIKALLASDISICFGNPGTSEMHFLAALDQIKGIRCVLGLHESIVTGAADGYYRLSGKPAVTLLHLAPRSSRMDCPICTTPKRRILAFSIS